MKQCELWNVLQNEDEHRLLVSADTKYDALITHIWALNNFAALFSNTIGVADWVACALRRRCDVIRKEANKKLSYRRETPRQLPTWRGG